MYKRYTNSPDPHSYEEMFAVHEKMGVSGQLLYVLYTNRVQKIGCPENGRIETVFAVFAREKPIFVNSKNGRIGTVFLSFVHESCTKHIANSHDPT